MSEIALTPSFISATRTRLERDGYIVVEEGLTPDDVARANAALDELQLPVYGDLRPLVDKGDVFLDHLVHPAILSHALALLGGHITVMGSCATVIPPGAEPMVWHEDGPRPWSYPEIGDRRALVTVRVGVFLEDLTQPDRGNLVVVPGSHKRPFRTWAGGPGQTPEGAIQVRVPAGSLVLFHNALWHSTAHNRMDHSRRVLYYGFSPSWHRIVDYVTPPQHLLDAIARRPEGQRGLLRQLVGAVPPSGAPGFYFPSEDGFPGLGLIAPDHKASGYD